MPCLFLVIPDIPLMSTSNPAFMAPDKRLSFHKLVNVELQSLRSGDIISEEVNVVDKVMQTRGKRMTLVWEALRRKVTDQVIIPKNIREPGLAADVVLCRASADRR